MIADLAVDTGVSNADDAEPMRLCVASRQSLPQGDMIRFVLDPSGAVVPDIKGKLPGRGVWVTATRADLETALRRNAFTRGFKAPARVGPDLVGQTERLLEQSALDALSIARKAGSVVPGFAKTENALRSGQTKAVLHASDAAPDGVRKLAGMAADLPAIRVFTSEQLDLALGRPHVIHAALLAGPASEAFLVRCRRLERFRTDRPERRAAASHGLTVCPLAES